MKRGIILLIGFLVLLIWIPLSAADDPPPIDLVAGQNTTIGTIEMNITGDTLTATFQATSPGWCMSTTHFYVSNEAPSHSAPGQFQYKHEDLGCVTTDIFSVPVPEGDVFVSAHADTHFTPGTYEVPGEDDEPLASTGEIIVGSGGSNSYLNVKIAGDDNPYDAWCIDYEHPIGYTTYPVNIHEASSAPDSIVDIRENLPLITYILNQDYSHLDPSATILEIQNAIWYLIDDVYAGVPLEAFPSNIRYIVEDALANGADFVPSCGGVIGVIVEPTDANNSQHLIIEYPAPCTGTVEVDGSARSETAWALADWGIEFNTGWGMYFQLVDVPDDEPPAPIEPPPAPIEPPPAPIEPPPAPIEPPPANNGNRARNEEAPGQDNSNDAPGSRRDEANGQQGGNSSQSNGNGNGHGN